MTEDDRPRSEGTQRPSSGSQHGRPPRDGDRKPAAQQGERKPYAKRDGDRSPRSQRDGDRKPYQRDGDRKPSGTRDGERKPYQRDGERKPYQRDGERKPYASRDGERKPYQRDGERKPYASRDTDRKPYSRDGDSKPSGTRDGERKPYQRDGERKPYQRDGERKPYQRDGERKPYQRDGDRKPSGTRDGERKPYQRDGERKPYASRDGERKPYQRDGERKPYQRDGERKPYGNRDADRKPYARRDGGDDRRSSRPPQDADRRRGPAGPPLPDDVTPFDLHGSARNELKTLSKENAEQVARHLAMVARLIEEDAALAHEHALAASRSAGRVGVVRETVAITAYAVGDYALALREARTYRRISGSDDQIALLVDSERGVGRPDRALEAGRGVDRSKLPVEVRVELAIAMSGARLDLGQTERALQELDIPELDPDRAFSWSPGLFAARAAVLEELGRDDESQQWQHRAEVAAAALGDVDADRETIEIDEIEEIVLEDDEDDEDAEDDAEDADEDDAEDADEDDADDHAVSVVDVADEAAVESPVLTEAQEIEAEVAELLADSDDAESDDAEKSGGDAEDQD